ncbi:MAG: hypothetical protein WKG01_38995 [Kofleriaceae bacterium]
MDDIDAAAPGPQWHASQRDVRVAQQLGELVGRDPRAEVLGRDILELVGLVEDHRVVLRQHARAGMCSPQRAIREVEVVIDQHELRLLGEPPRLGDEAALEVRTPRADPGIRRRGHAAPQRRILGEPLDLCAITARVARPVNQRAE